MEEGAAGASLSLWGSVLEGDAAATDCILAARVGVEAGDRT